MIYANYLELKEMTENKQLTDIYLICKGWYNKKLYGDELEAMNAYYHKHYSGCDDVVMDIPFALHLFLKPLTLEIINRDSDKARFLFMNVLLNENNQLFADVMYRRIMYMISECTIGIFDLSEYEDMFAKARACKYEDETIGII